MPKVTVVKCRVSQPPELAVIDDSLQGMRAAIGGGYVERVPFMFQGRQLALYVDENGLNLGLMPNRCFKIGDMHVHIVGDFVVVRETDDGEIESLDPKLGKALVKLVDGFERLPSA